MFPGQFCRGRGNARSYRDVEYRVLQGVGPNVWKWSVLFDAARAVGGDAATKASAIVAAERAIDRKLGPPSWPRRSRPTSKLPAIYA